MTYTPSLPPSYYLYRLMLGPRITTWIAWQTVAVSSFTRNASVMSSRKTLASMPLDEKMSPIAQSPKGGLLLKVRVKPGAKVTQLTGDFEDPLGIQVSAPPREGACNEALVEFVCDILNLKKRDVSLISGHKSREKVLALTGIDITTAQERLQKQLQLDNST